MIFTLFMCKNTCAKKADPSEHSIPPTISLFRFYFVSNPALLLILSQGSDPQQMQPYYEKVFDSVDRVEHSKADKTQIVEIHSILGPVRESVTLHESVKCANSNIEDWLSALEREMQRSMKRLCEVASLDCLTSPLRPFVNRTCGQFALLGLQVRFHQSSLSPDCPCVIVISR